MSRIERTYRERRLLLICAFVCSCFLFWVFCFPMPHLSPKKMFLWGLFNEPLKAVFSAAAAAAALMSLILFMRYVLFLAQTRRNPVLRRAVDDERIKTGWLRAYRVAFSAIVGVHLLYLVLEGRFYEWGLPHAAWVSSTMGLMTLFGAALYHTREAKDA